MRVDRRRSFSLSASSALRRSVISTNMARVPITCPEESTSVAVYKRVGMSLPSRRQQLSFADEEFSRQSPCVAATFKEFRA